MRTLKILFILLLIAFPYGELLRFDIGNHVRFKLLDILAGSITFYWLFLYITDKIKRPKIKWYFILFPLIGLVSLIINSIWLKPIELLVSSLYILRWISYAGIFFVVMQFDNSFKKKLTTLLLIDGVIIIILGFLQYFFLSDLKFLYHLGWDDHMYRMFSVFLDPNYAGGFLALYLLFLSGIVYKIVIDKNLKTIHVPLFDSISLSRKKSIIVLSTLIVLTVLALFTTFSRSSLIMFIVETSVFFVLIGRKRLILLLLTIIVLFVLVISPKFYVENINLLRFKSSNARVSNYQDALKITASQPLLGVGFDAYRYAKQRYNIQMGWVKAPSHADAGVDNSFLFVLATTGIAGLISYLLLWFYLFRDAINKYRKSSSIFAIIFISSGIGLFVHALFINSLFFPAIMLWMWIMAAFMENK